MSRLPQRMGDVLRGHQTLVLATADAAGQPEAAAVFFVLDEDRGPGPALICALLSRSAKLARIRENPRVAFFIGPQAPTRWLQGSGVARVVEEEPQRSQCITQLIAAIPDAAVFVERVPVTPVEIAVRALKLTDLTGESPPVVEMDLT
jgi:hypothetical protein